MHPGAELEPFILAGKGSHRCKQLIASPIDEYELVTCEEDKKGRLIINWDQLQEDHPLKKSEHRILLTDDRELLESASENNCKAVYCHPAGMIAKQAEIISFFYSLSQWTRQNLTLFLDMDGTTIIAENGTERINPHMLYFLEKIIPLFINV